MLINIFLNNKQLIAVKTNGLNFKQICTHIEETTNLQSEDYYLTCNGKRLNEDIDGQHEIESIHCILRQVGGKGGFGSMLRAIGAQIEKTTNREACRDLSGRRLRDINEEKRVRAWLEKQGEREREAEERKKRKIAKLLAVPKHEFKDDEYEEARAKLTEKVNDAFEEGLKQAEEAKLTETGAVAATKDVPASSSTNVTVGSKRKGDAGSKTTAAKKNKGALWIDDAISGSDSDTDDSEVEADTKRAVKC
ncbi:replication stress response regulator SDE2 [Drosophila novamexicana]|uniref:replication stress response regulator SDE2 n=1 Tax=Drosophila novamexicana TaxID=47314 RepID=UPI0011E58AFD|nr:replication stress response regulator SDE2 [Drosophila novamexicana]XP_030562801.1 replication stress response regulator SDE2 [Drosophila novamexicana]